MAAAGRAEGDCILPSAPSHAKAGILPVPTPSALSPPRRQRSDALAHARGAAALSRSPGRRDPRPGQRAVRTEAGMMLSDKGEKKAGGCGAEVEAKLERRRKRGGPAHQQRGGIPAAADRGNARPDPLPMAGASLDPAARWGDEELGRQGRRWARGHGPPWPAAWWPRKTTRWSSMAPSRRGGGALGEGDAASSDGGDEEGQLLPPARGDDEGRSCFSGARRRGGPALLLRRRAAGGEEEEGKRGGDSG
ncbi:hypothetical protein BS78_04G209000 [Paspalum vaginatum]|nr:hypothetical protein BS78_04G209000 [Paspalum vaginatum]